MARTSIVSGKVGRPESEQGKETSSAMRSAGLRQKMRRRDRRVHRREDDVEHDGVGGVKVQGEAEIPQRPQTFGRELPTSALGRPTHRL